VPPDDLLHHLRITPAGPIPSIWNVTPASQVQGVSRHMRASENLHKNRSFASPCT
jgi:hypothetical protein